MDLLDSAPCGFVSFTDDGVMLRVNSTLLRMLGRERAEVEGQHVQVLLTRGAKIFYQTHLFPLLKMKGEVEEIFVSIATAGGDEVPVLLNGRRVERDGVMVNECIVVRMRQRAVFEEELLKAKKAAQTASKAKDDFLAALSHELRNPLNPVLMLSTAMEMDLALPAEVRDQAGIIRRNAELEARLIDDLLDLTRIAHGKMKLIKTPVDVHSLLSQTQEIVRSDGQSKRVPVRFAKEARNHFVMADGARMQQVFWNLLKNAIKFTPSGKEVLVSTFNEGDDTLMIEVRDSGIGIEADVIPRIFDAFEQGKVSTQHFGGLGLGLAISRSIVQMHGGTIRAASEGK
ncbi:MAG TPA: HAMP domain-containing sensor histidine kinase, partial [Prosthecobacter sp.]|nr:HAMP domain-containing sensor histidine kinase [Prosthecobacter sp.]